jgi:hypothetical protein
MRPHHAAFAAFFMLAALLLTTAAFAGPPAFPAEIVLTAELEKEPTLISVPWGDWLASFLAPLQSVIATLLLAAATAVVAMLPAWFGEIVRPLILTWRTNQLFEKAAATAIAGVRGAIAGEKVDIPVANDLVRTVVLIAVQNAAPAVLDFAGRSARALAEKALARLHEQGIIMPKEYTISDASEQARKVLIATEAGTAA